MRWSLLNSALASIVCDAQLNGASHCTNESVVGSHTPSLPLAQTQDTPGLWRGRPCHRGQVAPSASGQALYAMATLLGVRGGGARWLIRREFPVAPCHHLSGQPPSSTLVWSRLIYPARILRSTPPLHPRGHDVPMVVERSRACGQPTTP